MTNATAPRFFLFLSKCEKSQYIIRQSIKKNNYKYLTAIAFEKPL